VVGLFRYLKNFEKEDLTPLPPYRSWKVNFALHLVLY